jgi:hypothetical protein
MLSGYHDLFFLEGQANGVCSKTHLHLNAEVKNEWNYTAAWGRGGGAWVKRRDTKHTKYANCFQSSNRRQYSGSLITCESNFANNYEWGRGDQLSTPLVLAVTYSLLTGLLDRCSESRSDRIIPMK